MRSLDPAARASAPASSARTVEGSASTERSQDATETSSRRDASDATTDRRDRPSRLPDRTAATHARSPRDAGAGERPVLGTDDAVHVVVRRRTFDRGVRRGQRQAELLDEAEIGGMGLPISSPPSCTGIPSSTDTCSTRPRPGRAPRARGRRPPHARDRAPRRARRDRPRGRRRRSSAFLRRGQHAQRISREMHGDAVAAPVRERLSRVREQRLHGRTARVRTMTCVVEPR